MAAVCGLGLLAVAGCGHGDRPALAPVHGRVTLDGKPLAGAAVHFEPESGRRASSGVTNTDGEYVLKYIRDDLGGAMGKNTVRISKQKTRDPASETVPDKYNTETILTADVTAGENDFPFELTSRSKK